MSLPQLNLHRVLIVGYTENVRGSLESSYSRALQQLGYKVIRWNPLAALSNHARFSRPGQVFTQFVHVEPWSRKANQDLLLFADKISPELIIIIGTSGVRAGTLAQLKVRFPKLLIYCIYPDSPHNLDQERVNCFPFFDRLTTSSPAWISPIEKLGGLNVHYLPFSADTELHRPVEPNQDPRFQSSISFIGTWRPEREECLEELADFDLKIWGSNYWNTRTRKHSPLRTKWTGRGVVGDEFSQVCANSKIMLNMLDVVTWPGPNMRTFEHSACQAFSLTTRSSAILDIFQEDETIVCFDTIDEARSKIQFYLSHETERARIAKASNRLIVEGRHTYLDRAKQLVRWFAEDLK